MRGWLHVIEIIAIAPLAHDWSCFQRKADTESTQPGTCWPASENCRKFGPQFFIIGHDACHQSLTPHRTLNNWLGRVAVLCSLTPYRLWDVGHNVVHHGYINLKGFDFVWAPFT